MAHDRKAVHTRSCEGSQELSLDTDERKMIVLTLDCDMAYID